MLAAQTATHTSNCVLSTVVTDAGDPHCAHTKRGQSFTDEFSHPRSAKSELEYERGGEEERNRTGGSHTDRQRERNEDRESVS